MAFKVRDLMINIAPVESGDMSDPCEGKNSEKSPRCGPPPVHDPCEGRNSEKSPKCGPPPMHDPCEDKNSEKSPKCGPPPSADKAREELIALKAQLQAEFARVE